VYGRYGSRNTSGKDQSDGLLSLAAFYKAAERALALHAAYPANKAALAAKTGPQSEYATPTKIPGLADRPAVATQRQNCIHCHMVKEHALRAKWEQGTLTAADLYLYPLPSNIGITTDLDDGLRITHIAAGSPAATSGRM
jgi:serine protease Do